MGLLLSSMEGSGQGAHQWIFECPSSGTKHGLYELCQGVPLLQIPAGARLGSDFRAQPLSTHRLPLSKCTSGGHSQRAHLMVDTRLQHGRPRELSHRTCLHRKLSCCTMSAVQVGKEHVQQCGPVTGNR